LNQLLFQSINYEKQPFYNCEKLRYAIHFPSIPQSLSPNHQVSFDEVLKQQHQQLFEQQKWAAALSGLQEQQQQQHQRNHQNATIGLPLHPSPFFSPWALMAGCGFGAQTVEPTVIKPVPVCSTSSSSNLIVRNAEMQHTSRVSALTEYAR